MTDAEFLGMLVIALCALLGLIGAVVTPLLKLNGTIEKLNGTLANILKENVTRDHRISEHGKQIDKHGKVLTEHEVRIKHLEGEE